MTLNEANALLMSIRDCQNFFSTDAPPVKFSFMLANNAATLMKEVKIAQGVVTEGLDMDALRQRDSRRRALCFERAARDNKGEPIRLQNNEFQLSSPDDVKFINDKLTEEFPLVDAMLATIAAREAEVGELNAEVALRQLPLDDWPDITAPLLERLMPLISESG